jgi:hypothetical protein
MFAPLVAKSQAKKPASSTNSLGLRSPLAPRRPGHSLADQALILQRTIGNQAVLRLMAEQRATSLPGNEPLDYKEQGSDASSPTARKAAPGVSWDFSRVPIFPPDRAGQTEPPAPRRAPPLPGILQAKLAVGKVDDPLEDEADQVADQVMRMPTPEAAPTLTSAPPQISRKCEAC